MQFRTETINEVDAFLKKDEAYRQSLSSTFVARYAGVPFDVSYLRHCFFSVSTTMEKELPIAERPIVDIIVNFGYKKTDKGHSERARVLASMIAQNTNAHFVFLDRYRPLRCSLPFEFNGRKIVDEVHIETSSRSTMSANHRPCARTLRWPLVLQRPYSRRSRRVGDL